MRSGFCVLGHLITPPVALNLVALGLVALGLVALGSGRT